MVDARVGYDKQTKTEARFTLRQRAFVDYYLQTWSGEQAARLAGYRGENLNRIGYVILNYPHIQAAIAERMRDIVMQANEVLDRLAQQARANVTDFIDFDKTGQIAGFNVAELEKRGHLVKKITQSTGKTNTFGLELYDAQNALALIAKHLGMMRDVTLNVDMGSLSTEQLERIANGEDPLQVIAR